MLENIQVFFIHCQSFLALRYIFGAIGCTEKRFRCCSAMLGVQRVVLVLMSIRSLFGTRNLPTQIQSEVRGASSVLAVKLDKTREEVRGTPYRGSPNLRVVPLARKKINARG